MVSLKGTCIHPIAHTVRAAGDLHEDAQAGAASVPEIVRESHRIAERMVAPQAGGAARQPNGFTHSSSAFPPPGRPPGSPDKPPRHSPKGASHDPFCAHLQLRKRCVPSPVF